MKIYIAGPIKSDPAYFEKFERTEAALANIGHHPVNPARNFHPLWNYKQYIDAGLKQLMTCDAIYMLEGYEHSDGAKLELHYARICGLHVFKAGQTVPGVREDEP